MQKEKKIVKKKKKKTSVIKQSQGFSVLPEGLSIIF